MIKIEGVQLAKAELAEWDWDNDPLKTQVMVEGASIVLDEMTNDRWLVGIDQVPELTIWPIGGDHLMFTIDIRAMLEEWFNRIGDYQPEDTIDFAAMLHEVANEYERRLGEVA
jgi:hypothetical protein